MLKIIHRVNTSEKLASVPQHYGVEIDLKAYGDRLVMQHEAFEDGEDFEEWIKGFNHAFIVLNTKETGIEQRAIDIVEAHGVSNWFLLDVEAPYLYNASNNGVHKIAVRYSEYEPIEMAEVFRGKVDWAWIDTATELPLNPDIVSRLSGFKTCLVCPERWGRPEDIETYANQMKELGFEPDAVMTALDQVAEWEKYYPN